MDWVRQPETSRQKVAYSQEVVDLLDHAALIAKASVSKSTDQGSVGVSHLLAAFASEESGLMGELRRAHGITSASWRAAIAGLESALEEEWKSDHVKITAERPRDYLTPEEAAEAVSVHVQTMRGYIRSSRLPAFRLAGERALRIRRADLEKVMEPL